MMRAAVILLVLAAPASAQTVPPETSPEPVQRPAEAADKEEPTNVGEEVDASVPGGGTRDMLRLDDAEYATCLATLDEMGVTYLEADPIVPADDVDCGILQPLTVTELAPGFAVTPPATIRCPTTRSLAEWTRDFVLPAAERLTDRGAITGVQNGSGYVCRRRNGVSDGKLSEHAFGNAFDVMGFTFAEGAPIAVQPREAEGSMAEAFQDAVRATACLEFATVLGPGSNAAHDDHLHLDIIERGGGYRLCEQGGATGD